MAMTRPVISGGIKVSIVSSDDILFSPGTNCSVAPKRRAHPKYDNRRKSLDYSDLLRKLCPDILRIIAL